jgi:hypothetical protein
MPDQRSPTPRVRRHLFGLLAEAPGHRCCPGRLVQRRDGVLTIVGGTHPRHRARRDGRRDPRRHHHDHQPGEPCRESGHLGDRRRLLSRRPTRDVLRRGGAQGLREGNEARREGRSGSHGQRRFHPPDQARGRGHCHRDEARGDGAEHPRLHRGADRGPASIARHRGHRRRGAQRGRVQRPEPGARTEPGRDARRLVGPDRSRPAGGQGAGGSLVTLWDRRTRATPPGRTKRRGTTR